MVRPYDSLHTPPDPAFRDEEDDDEDDRFLKAVNFPRMIWCPLVQTKILTAFTGSLQGPRREHPGAPQERLSGGVPVRAISGPGLHRHRGRAAEEALGDPRQAPGCLRHELLAQVDEEE